MAEFLEGGEERPKAEEMASPEGRSASIGRATSASLASVGLSAFGLTVAADNPLSLLARSTAVQAIIALRAGLRTRAAAPAWWMTKAVRRRRDRGPLEDVWRRASQSMPWAVEPVTGAASARPPASALGSTGTPSLKYMSSSPGLAVALIGTPQPGPGVVLKVARDAKAQAEIGRDQRARSRLKADSRLTGWHELVPDILVYDSTEADVFAVERHVGDVDGRRLLIGPPTPARDAFRCAMTAIGELHSRTSERRSGDDALHKEWVAEPITLISSLFKVGSWQARALARLKDHLERALSSRPVEVSWVHGDYSPGNLLFGRDGQLKGITDWGGAAEQGSSCFDTWLLTMTTVMLRTHLDMGAVLPALMRMLSGPSQVEHHDSRLAVSSPALPTLEALAFASPKRAQWKAWTWCRATGTSVLASEPSVVMDAARVGLWLCWLRHVATNLLKAEDYRRHFAWRVANIDVLLSGFASP